MNTSKMEGTSETRLAQFLVAAAHGCFLYTKMTLDLIERGHLKIKRSINRDGNGFLEIYCKKNSNPSSSLFINS